MRRFSHCARNMTATKAAKHSQAHTHATLYSHQAELPALPVPALTETIALYKRSLEPLYKGGAADPAYKTYCAKLDAFASAAGPGPALQAKLETFAASRRNWLAAFWDNYAYLDYREPVSPYVSYFFSHKDINSLVGKSQLHKGAAILKLVGSYAEQVAQETIAPEVRRGQPFCMESFRYMFCNGRKPGESRDYTAMHPPSRYAVVISNGYFYTVNVDASLGSLVKTLGEIQCASHGKKIQGVGALTGAQRDSWYKNYTELAAASPRNAASLDAIDGAIFVLCLDDAAPMSLEEKSRVCWHGDSANRWFDKPVQMFVGANGSSGFLGEHSKMDGTPTLSMNDWLVGELSKITTSDFADADADAEAATELPFDLTPNLANQIVVERAAFVQRTSALDIRVWQNYGLGKQDIKAYGCSPDSFVQMLIQLAYYKLTGTLRPTYESASTRKYFAGRTETCRSVTPETLVFVQTWEDTAASAKAKVAAFRAALAAHGDYIKRASDGRGVDRHLFGLSQMANEPLDVFTDPIHSYSQHWYLSTSQLSSENFNGYGWAPVVPEGLGLAYMINNEWIHVNVTCYKDNVFGFESADMAHALTQASLELKELLGAEKLKAKL